jgi:hypothetical protein
VDWENREGVIGIFQISSMFEMTSENVEAAERRISKTGANVDRAH